MKAIEVINRYANGERDFRRADLREQSFYGQELSGTDFTGADLRGANFTNALLREVNFTNVLAGVPTEALLGQLGLTFLVAVGVESIGLFLNAFFMLWLAAAQATSGYTNSFMPISRPLLVFICLHVAIALVLAHQGLTRQALKSLAFVGASASLIVVVAALASESAIAVAALAGMMGAVAIAAGAVTATIAAISINAITDRSNTTACTAASATALTAAAATAVGVSVAITAIATIAVSVIIVDGLFIMLSVGFAHTVPPMLLGILILALLLPLALLGLVYLFTRTKIAAPRTNIGVEPGTATAPLMAVFAAAAIDKIAAPDTTAVAIGVAIVAALLNLYVTQQTRQGNPCFTRLHRAGLAVVTLSGTTFCGADLTKANFTNAKLEGTRFQHSKQKQTDLTGVCWQDAIGVPLQVTTDAVSEYVSNRMTEM